ncbi:alpha/beta hydrolase [Aureibacillus halotolerans]|uniref:S-formylglutathione hydrolase FrmB n=1 Tax=Aureibacillus halotolerans TaxID=1508390 RepID=A0A4R6U3V7_9BACI|nr:alpha/beta hydrolase family protein [Aureibacillus halotolerans]TDQ39115.1 S-formylglutathione hydrolase FrmB [Aureibacillus halotolerans]
MARLQCSIHSETLGLSTSVVVLLPDMGSAHYQLPEAGLPTLYLLHGLSDDSSIWTRKTSIERYVEEMNIAVVMPEVNKSFYTDMHHGDDYWTFLTEELPRFMERMLPLSKHRNDRFVAGLSMGGYGAFKWALTKPDQISYGASLSGVVDIQVLRMSEQQAIRDLGVSIFGTDERIADAHNLFSLMEQNVHRDLRPTLYQCCGTEDYLINDNVRFKEACQKAGFPLHYEEEPGGHTWAYWDEKIQSVLQWLPINIADPEK